jgi:hypothetical protein
MIESAIFGIGVIVFFCALASAFLESGVDLGS